MYSFRVPNVWMCFTPSTGLFASGTVIARMFNTSCYVHHENGFSVVQLGMGNGPSLGI